MKKLFLVTLLFFPLCLNCSDAMDVDGAKKRIIGLFTLEYHASNVCLFDQCVALLEVAKNAQFLSGSAETGDSMAFEVADVGHVYIILDWLQRNGNNRCKSSKIIERKP